MGEVEGAGSLADASNGDADESRDQAKASTALNTSETVAGDNNGGAGVIFDAGHMRCGVVGLNSLEN